MQGIMYSCSFDGITLASASGSVDFFELDVPASTIVLVHYIHVGQSSDAGDAQAELARITLNRSTLAGGAGGTSVTPRPLNGGDPASGVTVVRTQTTPSSVATVVHAETWNIQAGFYYRPTPQEIITVSPGTGSGFSVNHAAALADDVTISGTLIFEEIQL